MELSSCAMLAPIYHPFLLTFFRISTGNLPNQNSISGVQKRKSQKKTSLAPLFGAASKGFSVTSQLCFGHPCFLYLVTLSHSPLCYLNRSACDPQPGTFSNTTSNHPTRNFMPMALLWPRTTSTINATSAKMASTMPKVIGTSITLCIGHIAWTAAPPGMAWWTFPEVGRVKLLRWVFCRSMKTTAGTMNFILLDDGMTPKGFK